MKVHGMRMAVLLGLLSLSSSPVLAESPPKLRKPQIRLFPGAELTVEAPPGFHGTQMLFELVTDTGQVSASWLAGIESDGKVRTRAHCTFIGGGKLRMREPDSAPTGSQEIEIDCSLAPSVAASPAPSTFGLRAVATLATEPPVEIPGLLDLVVFSSSATDRNETSLTRGDGESRTVTRTQTYTFNQTIQNGQADGSFRQTGTDCCSNTRGSAHDEFFNFNGPYDCGLDGIGCFTIPPINVDDQISAPLLPNIAENFTPGSSKTNAERRQEFISARDPRMSVTSVQTTRGDYASEYRLRWVFPSLPEGESLGMVAIDAEPSSFLGVVYYGSLDSYKLDVLETSRSVMPEAVGLPTGACPSPTSVPSLRWLFEGPSEGNKVTVRMIPAPGCSFTEPPINEHVESPDGTLTTTQTSTGLAASMNARYRATTVAPPLMIAPDTPVLAPTWPARTSDPNDLGVTATQIKAILVDVEPGDYTVQIRIADFEIMNSGHAGHGAAPTHVWGAFDESVVDGQIPHTECEITVDMTRSGACSVDFQANEVAGRVKLVATTTIAGETKEAKADLDVRVEGLINFQSLPGDLGGFSRNPLNDIGHPDSTAFHATPLAAARLLAMMADYRRLTQAANFPGHPDGLVFRVNDMTLPWGGLFDYQTAWSTPHGMHRNGKSVDINIDVVDARDISMANPPTVNLGRGLIDQACRNLRGRPVPEGSIHCEFDLDR